ncbi:MULTISPECIES: hypothetical protein [Streptococcus]|uniref:Xre-like reg n=2 Tax=Streptococcus TaxID=1301 RepID=A0A380JE39_STRDO|nr:MULTISPECIES: hypothetical protein [Streptococcus]OZV23710.1 hypothetical protein RO09_04390 [Streptococcus sobrinus]SUN36253.1 Xre-like reg [Streptococcus downei MFe28]
MSHLKWFSGSKERRTLALEIFDTLIAEVAKMPDSQELQRLCMSYRHELDQWSTPIPAILLRFNLELSKLLRENQLELPLKVQEELAELRKLSYIRYGH